MVIDKETLDKRLATVDARLESCEQERSFLAIMVDGLLRDVEELKERKNVWRHRACKSGVMGDMFGFVERDLERVAAKWPIRRRLLLDDYKIYLNKTLDHHAVDHPEDIPPEDLGAFARQELYQEHYTTDPPFVLGLGAGLEGPTSPDANASITHEKTLAIKESLDRLFQDMVGPTLSFQDLLGVGLSSPRSSFP